MRDWKLNPPVFWIALAIGLVVVASYFLFFAQPTVMADKTFPSASNYPSYSIPELKQIATAGNYNTEGFIVFVSECQPCPPGAQCSPCAPNHIVVLENASTSLERYPEEALIIIWDDGRRQQSRGQFQTGKKHVFSVSVDPSIDGTIGGQKAGVRLIGYDLLD